VCVAMKQATSRRDSLRRPGPDEFISRELVHFYFTIELRPAAEHSGLSTRAPAIWPITASFSLWPWRRVFAAAVAEARGMMKSNRRALLDSDGSPRPSKLVPHA
jgi:hypothetical protein